MYAFDIFIYVWTNKFCIEYVRYKRDLIWIIDANLYELRRMLKRLTEYESEYI